MKYLVYIVLFFYGSILLGQSNIAIVGNEVSFKTLDIKEAKMIFRGKYNYWKNKNKVTLVLPSSKNPNSSIVAQKIYNSNSDAVKRYWLSQVFQGRFSSPVFLDSDQEIIEFVSKNPGAIGLISISKFSTIEDQFKITLTE